MANQKVALAGGLRAYRVKTIVIDYKHFLEQKLEFNQWIVERRLEVTWDYSGDHRSTLNRTIKLVFDDAQAATEFVAQFCE